MKKKFPVGIDDFKEIIEENYYVVDKTGLIEELLESKSKITLIPRPRRFGKTLNMSMLRYFFDIEGAEENRKLFSGLKIEKSRYMETQGTYPVIYMSFKDIKSSNWEMCLEKTKNLIADLYSDKDYLKESLKDSERNRFDRILNSLSTQVELEDSLGNLSKYLHKYYGKKPIILIDEYDTPLNSAYTQGYYAEAILFFKNLMSGAFKSNENLELGVMTGIMRIARESIFSGLNNLDVSTILSNGYQHFGLTEIEVEELLRYYGLEYEMEDVKRWYNGYRFGKLQMYNPWSIIHFVKNDELKSYWVNTSSNELIVEILLKKDEEMFSDLEKLFRGETIKKYLSDEIVFDRLDKLSNIWSLFFFSGYLTISGEVRTSATNKTLYDLTIPNYEVRSFFEDTFIDRYSSGESGDYYSMIDELYFGNVDKFVKELKKIYGASVSYHDKDEKEKPYHHFMLGMVLCLNNKYRILSNRETGDGRADLTMFPREKEQHGIIIEVKVTDSVDKLKEKSQEAVKQIKDMGYEKEMRAEGVEKIIKMGVAFCGKELEISWENLKN